MDKTTQKSWWQAHRPTTRRLVQLYSALLHNAYVRGFLQGEIYKGKAKYACVPGLNCYSCPGAAGACPLGALQNALASTGHRAGWYVLGILLLFGVTLGRTICGWLCPFGLVQELAHRVPTPKIRKSRITRGLTWLKYLLLAVFVIALPLWYGLRHDLPLPAFCKYICPAGTLEGAVGHLANPVNTSMFSMLGTLFTRKWIILLGVGLLCVFCYRGFCRFLCPLGAIYGLFNRLCLVGVKVDASRCNGCGACVNHCGMDVKQVGDHECIHCGKCVAVCHQGAIRLQAGRITLQGPALSAAENAPAPNKKRPQAEKLLWGAALTLLALALLWFNVLDPAAQTAEHTGANNTAEAALAQGSEESAAPPGHEVGQRLPDFTLTCYDGSTFRLADCRGKITFINLWATYCTPCKAELPYFSDLYTAHEGDIAMICVHPALVLDDPEAYLADRDYAMPFATDTEENTVVSLVAGTGTLPQTVVLNRKGEVIYNAVGSVTPELLSALYDEADAGSPNR